MSGTISAWPGSGLETKTHTISSSVCTFFSFAWYRDDMNDVLINPEGKTTILGMSKGGLAVLHLFGTGIFTRYGMSNDYQR